MLRVTLFTLLAILLQSHRWWVSIRVIIDIHFRSNIISLIIQVLISYSFILDTCGISSSLLCWWLRTIQPSHWHSARNSSSWSASYDSYYYYYYYYYCYYYYCSVAAKKTGGAVTQVFPESGNMGKVLPEYLCQWTTEKVRNEGVNVITNAFVKSASTADGGRIKLTLNDGKEVGWWPCL